MHLQRVLVWTSRSWNKPKDGSELIVFGEIGKDRWERKITVTWSSSDSLFPEVRTGIGELGTIRHYQNLCKRLEALEDAGVSVEQFAVMLAENGFVDYTDYQRPDAYEQFVMHRELQSARTRAELFKTRLASCETAERIKGGR